MFLKPASDCKKYGHFTILFTLLRTLYINTYFGKKYKYTLGNTLKYNWIMEFKEIFEWFLFSCFIKMVMAREMHFLRLHNNMPFMTLVNLLQKEINEQLYVEDKNGGLKEKCSPCIQVFENLVSHWWCYLVELWNIAGGSRSPRMVLMIS